MKKWLTPTSIEDKFIPNEAASTCYALAYKYDDANKYESKHFHNYNVIHGENGCGSPKNQKLTVINGYLTKLVELSNGQQDHIPDTVCTLYTNKKYNRPVQGGLSVKEGTQVSWTTSSGNKTWHHQGKIIKAVDSKSMS